LPPADVWEGKSMTEWAAVAEVASITGATVTQAQRDIAARTLETLHGLIEDVARPDISDRDRHFLKLACAYQAAFVKDNPDLFSRLDVTSASQDGESATFRNVDAHMLAPLARKSIRRLSWHGRRLLAPGGGSLAPTSRVDVNSEAFDDALPWGPV
jgi:hypothetical protein